MNAETINANFVDDPSILNLEVGAGCGGFGRIFFPKCYITTLDEKSIENCTTSQIDRFCDACNLPWENCRFSITIICNPFHYGFDSPENTKKLMDEVTRVLHHGGEIIILGHYKSRFFRLSEIDNMIKNYIPTASQPINDITIDINEIDPALEYPGYNFYQVDGKTPTKPSHRVLMKIKKTCNGK